MSKRHLLLTTAAAAALVGAMTASAMAFDSVDWNWTNAVNQTTNIGINIGVTQTNPDLGQVEAGQAFLGNAASTANSSNINNNAVANVTIDNDAASILNNQSLNADDTLLVHSGQFALGSFDDGITDPNWDGFQDALTALGIGLAIQSPLFAGQNSYTVLALATLAAAGNGYVVPANITSNASLSTSVGNDVSNTATGVANNAIWNVTGNTDDNNAGLIVGDLTQLGFANITTNATANTVLFTNTTPVFNNNASSIGNSLNVRVNSPAVPE